ncbi:MAG: Pyruvate-flavodoxin oxidoreductase [Candidatus Hydrogenedentes bacterium ADurb.Bin101]|nr:MAG: Pyruvate-flavodoxin oxidoreductase [Candidatus Hydrogenedentes bacterium ADurb.Bin101]
MTMNRPVRTMDGNEAVAHVAYQVSEVAAIYPITPSSPMGEWADQWMSEGRKNIWGTTPLVVEMQSEAGASAAVHGALQSGSLVTTFTASQGLLLMLPNMFKIAGELTPTVFHITARTVATHALSIFGDHSDVMAARSTGFGMLCSNSIQETHDMALIAHAATLEARIPFMHFFDGFRTSHEVNRIEMLLPEDIRAMIDDELVFAHRQRAMSPDRPVIRGTAQNPDIFFTAREACNPYYDACPEIVQKVMDKFAAVVGRNYHLFDYVGAPDAERVIVVMGSAAEAVTETIEYLAAKGEKIGGVIVRLYRPFSAAAFINALPPSVKTIAVLDRTKEPGAAGEPMFMDVFTAVAEAVMAKTAPFKELPVMLGGRYGLSSREFTAAMVKGIFDEMALETPRKRFTVGIKDDVGNTSIDYDPNFTTESPDTTRAIFFGLGADGTVGANKNSIKIIGEDAGYCAQGYFVYDSRKSGAMTTSHLRFGPKPIRSTYLISRANFVACHQFSFMEKFDLLKCAEDEAVFLLNSIYGPEEVWDHLPKTAQRRIIEKKLKFYVINGFEVAKAAGMGGRINTVMQTCFFYISGVLPQEQAIESIKTSIKKTYGKRGESIVQKNCAAVDMAIENMHEVKVPATVTSKFDLRPPVAEHAPEFLHEFTSSILVEEGDTLPVSKMPVDGTFPVGTTQWEKRNIALEIPFWDPETCIQCGKCGLVCPHAVIRSKIVDAEALENAPEGFKSAKAKWKDFPDKRFVLQIAPEDCTGCTLCVQTCPAKNKQEPKLHAINMVEQVPIRERERACWDFFLTLPEVDRNAVKHNLVKDVQLLQPLFEFSGACAGCGETPYLKLLSQLFGDRLYVGNATGCSSIYGGNLPTTPWAPNKEGRGPTWNNSLFEDAAEFSLGMRVTIDRQTQFAEELLKRLEGGIGGELVQALLENSGKKTEPEILEQRRRVALLKEKLAGQSSMEAKALLHVADFLVHKSVWGMGGDGWAYDIGFGGLDHVIASGYDINLLVLDTEVYSNTGGQCSKSTPRAAVAKFAAGGKTLGKKDLALIAMTYGSVYVGHVALGANDSHTVKTFLEAEAYPGPSLIIAYSHCIAHGYNLSMGLEQQKAAVQSGHWPLFRFNPALKGEGKNPFQLDSKVPDLDFEKYAYNETRYKMLTLSKPEVAKQLLVEARKDIAERWRIYSYLADMPCGDSVNPEPEKPAS